MESVTDMVAEAEVDVPHGTITYRTATLQDELHLTTAFSKMLRELEPLGHDVLPTEHNLSLYWTHIFARALREERHGLFLAFTPSGQCIGCSFFTPEYNDIDTPLGRAIAHGMWVDPDHRKQGVAWRLQAMAHGRLSQLGFIKLLSYVVKDNVAGLASATSAGAEVTGYQTTVNLCVEVD